MKHHSRVMVALVYCLSVAAIVQCASGQGLTRKVYQPSGGPPKPDARTDKQPPVRMSAGQRPVGNYSDGFVAEGFSLDGYGPDGYCDDGGYSEGCYGAECGWDDGCCDTCGGYGCDGRCRGRGGLGCILFGWICPPGRYFFTADYLYVRANFSEAVAYLEQDDQSQNAGTDVFHELDFQYESSYRFGGGYRLGNCGEEIRFMFTRLSSDASDVAPSGSFLPYSVTAPPEGQTFIDADVDLKTYDVEFVKTIPLGGRMGCECGGASGCGDACGCGDGCACDCPAWDITWSGGMRFADVDWNRSYAAVDEQDEVTAEADAVMDFRGGGVRMGLEGRRYFCRNGCLSVFLKGDISLLLGDLKLESTRVEQSDPNITNTQTFSTRQIIPVTEVETGLTGHITCNTSITTGYLFSAWHDLGFRDEFNFPTLMETRYDDANILGFDGFFARLEVAY